MKLKNVFAKSMTVVTLSICMVAGCLAGIGPLKAIETLAAPYTEPCEADVRNNGDGTMDVILKGDDDGTNLDMFDYGLVYDNTKVSVEKIQWDSSFEKKYTDCVEGQYGGILAEADLGTYVVVGGVHTDVNYSVAADEKIVVVTFKVKDGQNPGEILLTDDSAQYDKDFTDAVGVILQLSESGLARLMSYEAGAICTSEQLAVESVLGDANGDSKVDLADAQLVLKAALKISTMSTQSMSEIDVNDDSKVDLKDAQSVLKVALKISTFDKLKNEK